MSLLYFLGWKLQKSEYSSGLFSLNQTKINKGSCHKKKKKLLILFSSCAFVALMLFNVSVSMEDTGTTADISLSGISALAYCEYQENGCDGGGYCYVEQPCPPGDTLYAVACWGVDSCRTIFNVGVDCDGIVNWCY